MRRSLRLVLEGAGGINVIGEATDLVGALDNVLSLRPDVLVLDLSMRGGSSLELIEHMRQEQPDTEIVAATMLRAMPSHAGRRRSGRAASWSRTPPTRSSRWRFAGRPGTSATQARG